MTVTGFRHISVDEVASDLDAGRPLVVLDIRDPQSFAAGHIPGATRLHDGNAQQYTDAQDKSVRTVVCCYHGHSSQGAAAWLVDAGYSDVYSLDGGATEWAIARPTQISSGGDGP